MKNFEHLSQSERADIHMMLGRGKSFRAIGRKLKRSHSTILREVGRNYCARMSREGVSYYDKAREAEELSRRRRKNAKRELRGFRKIDGITGDALIKKLIATEYSPEKLVINSFEFEFSGSTARRYLKKHGREYLKYLPCQGKKYRSRLSGKRLKKRLKEGVKKESIHNRAEEINNRSVFGHYEGDLIVCKQSKACLLVLTERVSRHIWVRKIANKESETVHAAMLAFFSTHHALSITLDNGGEFAKFLELEKSCSMKTYFCDPYCSWQKGGVENRNKFIRRYVKKRSDIALVSEADILRYQELVNDCPLYVLENKTPNQVYKTTLEELFIQ